MSTRERVLQALIEAAERGVSGQEIAEALGVSRTAIAKHVAALEAEGYVIEAARGRGYRLVAGPIDATPAGVRPLINSRFWTSVLGGWETGSTNDDARRLAQEGASEGTVVVAASQSAGRGRLGRTWSSPEGGAYLSVILRPAVSVLQASSLPLALGVAVARAFAKLGVASRLKWPNDVLLAEGKVAGVLVEMAAEADLVDWLVAGIGMNVSRGAGNDEARAAYLSDVAAGLTPAVVSAAVLDEVAAVYDEWKSGGFGVLAGEYGEWHSLSGQQVVVRDAMGRVSASGRVVGVDADGRLLLDDGAGAIQRVAAGEVTLRQP